MNAPGLEDNQLPQMDEAHVIGDRGTELWRRHFWTEFGGANASFLDPWGNQLMLWAHLDGVEVDEDTHEVIGEASLPDDFTIE